MGTFGGKDNPRPENMRIVSIPERNWSDPLSGLGVVGRDGIGVADLEITPFSFVSLGFFPSFQDILDRKSVV